ncbi:hypothetical protein Dsin_008267 [Dipteronia sinensis]|uniref:Reverse transcriptase zinc-binding domain-containing protein n=1 Tax=Dipteronia sinensis TaxID=43782 RepID=A0AAE0EB15_9ROSI|nr:hypothetical protein Dsin_008267 [Dipteronia sinensis]
MQHFFWILFHGKTLTNSQRDVHGLTGDVSCPRCESGIEDVNHLLRSCRVSIAVWENISRGVTTSTGFNDELDSWLASNLCNGKVVNSAPNYLQFALSLWFLWKWRCNKVFDATFSVHQSHNLIVNSFSREWLKANFIASAKITGFITVA